MRRGMAPLAILLCTAGAFLATAVDGRDFAGIYDITNEIESEESVMLTFTTEFTNYTGVDIVAATVRLENILDPESPYAAFMPVDILANGRVRLSQDITLPIRERDAWREGARPRLSVEYVDGQGNTHRTRVELMRDVPAEEVQP